MQEKYNTFAATSFLYIIIGVLIQYIPALNYGFPIEDTIVTAMILAILELAVRDVFAKRKKVETAI